MELQVLFGQSDRPTLFFRKGLAHTYKASGCSLFMYYDPRIPQFCRFHTRQPENTPSKKINVYGEATTAHTGLADRSINESLKGGAILVRQPRQPGLLDPATQPDLVRPQHARLMSRQ